MQTLNKWAERLAVAGTATCAVYGIFWWLWDLLEGYVPLIVIGPEG